MADREAFDVYVRERWVPLLRTATLLTGDRRLAHAAGPTCTIELLRTPRAEG